MNDERFAMKLVESARFHLRQKLDDIGGLPCIEIPYSKREFERIKEIFSIISECAGAHNLIVSYAQDGTQHLRWEYKFKTPIDISSK